MNLTITQTLVVNVVLPRPQWLPPLLHLPLCNICITNRQLFHIQFTKRCCNNSTTGMAVTYPPATHIIIELLSAYASHLAVLSELESDILDNELVQLILFVHWREVHDLPNPFSRSPSPWKTEPYGKMPLFKSNRPISIVKSKELFNSRVTTMGHYVFNYV